MNLPWYKLSDEDQVDSPSLIIYKERVEKNIDTLIESIDDVARLRPHIKTHKSSEVSRMFIEKGIVKFKCATIAEAEMLADSGAKDILLAHQPVGPKQNRLLELSLVYPDVRIATIVDDLNTARSLSETFASQGRTLDYYIDLNVGMNRTGIAPASVPALFRELLPLKNLKFSGLHVYDGHIRDENFQKRTERCNEAFAPVPTLLEELEQATGTTLTVIAGGTPTYSIHAKRERVECSPGTFVYWDMGYESILKEQHYLHAALVFTRVVSIPEPGTVCVDLGHKAIASENPLPNRVFFLNVQGLEPVGHSEEHMVLKIPADVTLRVGDVLYGVPYHVCPTIALYDEPYVVEDHRVTQTWHTLSRNRKITI